MSTLVPHYIGQFASDAAASAFISSMGWRPTGSAVQQQATTTLTPGLLYKNSTSGLYRIYGASGWEALGGASGDDGLLDIVAPASSPYNILADDTGKWIINTASESDWTLNLPTATVGLHYHFTQAWDSVNLDIRPQGGEGFRNEGAFFARMAVIGGSLEVGCAEAGTWDVLDSYQAFTFQNPAPPPA